jgi:hypothetical protein
VEELAFFKFAAFSFILFMVDEEILVYSLKRGLRMVQ